MKYVLRKPGYLNIIGHTTTRYQKISKAGVITDYIDERDITERYETCAVNRGKGKWSYKETNQGPLHWRQPSPFFRKNIQIGGNPAICSFDGQKSDGTRLVGTAEGLGDYDISDVATRLTLDYVGTSSLPGFYTLDQMSKTRCLLKIKDQKVDLSVAAAELHKSVAMLASTATSVYRMYRAVRKGDFLAFTRELKPGTVRRPPPKGWSTKDPASRWLELQYGWFPLISDVVGTADWLNTSPAAQLTFRSTGSAVEEFSHLLDHKTTNRPAQSVITGKRVSKCVVHWQMEDYRKHRNAQGGLINPLTVAWELIPFSFVVDWFLPIGNWLQTFDATRGTAFISGTQTRFINAAITGACSVRAYTPKVLVPQSYTSSMESLLYGGCLGVSRSIYAKYPFALPYFKNPLSATHVANAIALARGLRPR